MRIKCVTSYLSPPTLPGPTDAIDDMAHCTFPTSHKNKLFAALIIAH